MIRVPTSFAQIYNFLFCKNKFLSLSFIVSLAQILGGILGYVYQILMGRMLLPSEFALFSALMAFFMFLSAPISAMSLLITRKVSEHKGKEILTHSKSLFWFINKLLFFICAFIAAVFWINRSQFMEYLNLSDVVGFALFQIFLILSIFNAVNSAFFQGLQNFICIAFLGILTVALKILISAGLILAGLQLNGALLGIVSSLLFILIIGVVILINQLPDADVRINFRLPISIFKQAYPVFVAAIATAAMTQLDMVLVNWYFPAEEASLYAAASVLGKAILYLPGGLIVILFPLVSESKARGENSFRIFRQAVVATIICCGTLSTLYFLFSDFIINIFFGHRYDGAGNILKWYGFAILPMTLVLIAEHYLIAKGKVLFAWLFLAVAPLQVLAIHFWHSQLLEVLLCMGIFGSLLALIGYLYMYIESKVVLIGYN